MRDQNRCVTLVKLYPRGFRLLVIRLVAANVPVANSPWQTPFGKLPFGNCPGYGWIRSVSSTNNRARKTKNLLRTSENITDGEIRIARAIDEKNFWLTSQLVTGEKLLARGQKNYLPTTMTSQMQKLAAHDQTSHTQTPRHLLTTIRRHTLKRYVRQTHQSASEIQIQTTNQITERVGSNFYDKKQ